MRSLRSLSVASLQKRPNNFRFVRKSPLSTEATEVLMTVPHFIQTAVCTLQSSTGLPWWATFGLSTAFVKVGVFPLVRKQVLVSRKVTKAMPDIAKLQKLFTERMSELIAAKSPPDQKIALLGTFMDGTQAALAAQDVSISQFLGYTAVNMTVFITFMFSLRDLILSADSQLSHDLAGGGMLWFEDLTHKDVTLLLPLSAVAATYIGIELSFRRQQLGNKMLIFKDFIQTFPILLLPLTSYLPAGVFCYWIPSSLLAVTQTLLLQNTTFLNLVGLGLPANSSRSDSTTSPNDVVGAPYVPMTAEQLSAVVSEITAAADKVPTSIHEEKVSGEGSSSRDSNSGVSTADSKTDTVKN